MSYYQIINRTEKIIYVFDRSPIRHGEDLNAILGDISTVPDMYREQSPIRTQPSYQRPTSASAPTSNQLFNTLPEPAAPAPQPAPQKVAPPPPTQSLSPQPPVQQFSPTPVQYSASPVQSFSPAPAAFSPAPAASPAMQQQQTFSPPPPMKQTPSPQPSQPA